jgi:pimeloyl-ACP methyl ester carboxylesterase
MTQATHEFVLVHGAAHGAWCWDDATRRLEAKGHRVVTLDLPGHGRRAAEAAQASVGAYARAVTDVMAREGVSRGVVVGHSMSGVVIPKVAELAPGRVSRLVFLAAVVLPDGSSLMQTHMPPTTRSLWLGLAAGGGGRSILFPASMALSRWMGDLDPSRPETARAFAFLTPQPLRPVLERVDMRVFYSMRVPCTYIRCLRDAAVSPTKAAEYAARLGVAPIDLDADHDAMLSAPEALVRILDRL